MLAVRPDGMDYVDTNAALLRAAEDGAPADADDVALAEMDDDQDDEDGWEDLDGSPDSASEQNAALNSSAVAQARQTAAAIKAQANGALHRSWPLHEIDSGGMVEANAAAEDDDDLAEYNLDAYDDEEEGARNLLLVSAGLMSSRALVDMTFGGAAGLGNLTYYTSNKEDPYIVMKDDVCKSCHEAAVTWC